MPRLSGSPSNLVISSGSTLGTFSGIQSRIAVLAINNAGSIELAAVNVAGGQYLTETGLISTTAEGGAGAADSATVVYSTTARSNVAYRVLGYVESTQATAGTWASAPSTIQGAGGFAMVSRGMVSGLAVATTSGTSVDVTGIGAGAKRIQINLNAVSTNGTSTPLLQIGDSGGVETSGYVSAAQNNGGSYTTSTAGMLLTSSAAATDSTSGTITLSLVDASAQTWVCSAVLNKSSVSTVIAGGVKSLSPGPLDRIRLTTSGGTDTFDAGSLNVMVEY